VMWPKKMTSSLQISKHPVMWPKKKHEISHEISGWTLLLGSTLIFVGERFLFVARFLKPNQTIRLPVALQEYAASRSLCLSCKSHICIHGIDRKLDRYVVLQLKIQLLTISKCCWIFYWVVPGVPSTYIYTYTIYIYTM
jgi:hypothetical protein